MARWNKADIPHKGWEYIGMEDLGEDIHYGEEVQYEQCDMCGYERIRYVHILKHRDVSQEFRVGRDCASRMIEDYVNPEQNERELRNRANRRKNFLKQEWRYMVQTGNYTLRYKGENITIVKGEFGSWGVVFQGNWRWDYKGRKMNDIDTAKLIAFDLFDQLHESSSNIQPYWDGYRWIHC